MTISTISQSYQVFNADRRLQLGDISQALAEYEKQPAVIIINPKNEKYAGEVPPGVKLVYKSNVLLTEVWLSDSEHIKVTRRHKMFDATRDRAIIAAGGFFCGACLVGKPPEQQSPDPRYCQGCYDVLMKESQMLSGHIKRGWEPIKVHKTSSTIPRDSGLNKSTVNGEKNEVDIIKPVTPQDTHNKRGPKFTELPMDIILELAGQGLGSKAITAQLVRRGYLVSYKTIQRRLQGEMRLD